LFDLDEDGYWNIAELKLFLDNVVGENLLANAENTLGSQETPNPDVVPAVSISSESSIETPVRGNIDRQKFLEFVQTLQKSTDGTAQSDENEEPTAKSSSDVDANASTEKLVTQPTPAAQPVSEIEFSQKLTPDYVTSLNDRNLWESISKLFTDQLMKKK